MNECENKNLTIKQLQEKIGNDQYNRLSYETKNKLIKKEQLNVDDLVPNPILIKNNLLKERLTEYDLK